MGELLVYKHFHHIEIDIDLTKEPIISNWKQMQATNYDVWHVIYNTHDEICSEHKKNDNEMDMMKLLDMNKW